MFSLRDYQIECVNTILHRFKDLDSQLVQLPTGAGKTVILWHVLKALSKKALIVAPTVELTEQLEDTGQLVVPFHEVYRKKKSYWPTNCKYLVMTCQAATFAMKGSGLDDFAPEMLVVDEAHRSRSNNLEKLIEHFKAKGAKVLGLTATPERMDGRSLLGLYDELTYSATLIDLIQKGYLVDLECYRITTRHRIKEMQWRAGDIAPASLRELDVDARNQIILDVYNRTPGKKTLVFCLNVDHACKMAREFQLRGIKAMAIYGAMGVVERKAILKLFKEGAIDVLCNCQLLTEGFDEPSIEALILARPTKSKALYCQMIGRGVRPYEGKSTCLVYDLTDEIHNICSFNVLGGLPTNSGFEFNRGEKLTQAVQRYGLTIDEVDYDCERFSLVDSQQDTLYAVRSQKELLDYYNIPFLADITMSQAAYLIFKTMLMRKYGIDTQEYWQKWRRVLPRSDKVVREAPDFQELFGL